MNPIRNSRISKRGIKWRFIMKTKISNGVNKSFTIHDLPKEERPRERLVKFGGQALSVK